MEVCPCIFKNQVDGMGVVLTTHRLAYLSCQCDASLDMKLALGLVVARNEGWRYPESSPLTWKWFELPKYEHDSSIYRDLTSVYTNDNKFVILLSRVYFGDWVTKICHFSPLKTNNSVQLRTEPFSQGLLCYKYTTLLQSCHKRDSNYCNLNL